MHPKVFIRAMEEQLRGIRNQCEEVGKKGNQIIPGRDEILEEARIWFLRTLENTELNYDDIPISAVDYLADESLSRQKAPPFVYNYPSIIWMIATLEREQIIAIFGSGYYERFMNAISYSIPKNTNRAFISISRKLSTFSAPRR